MATAAISFSSKALRTAEPPISALIAMALANPDLVNFAAGLVDPLTLPTDETADLTAAILTDDPRARQALQYDTTLGLRPLRQRLLEHLSELEGKPAEQMGFGADDILVTTGSQQSLYLIAESLIDEGDIVLAENPSYFVFTGALASFGARVMAVPMDADGMRVDMLETLLADLERQNLLHRVKFIYVTSYYQNPTGLSLSMERRKKLLELARAYSKKHRILILEDAAYRELRYDGPVFGSIKGMEGGNEYSVYAGTFSKPFSPGIKTGYAVMPPELMTAALRQKGNHDFGSAALCQYVALEALTSGVYARHVARLRESYRAKRDATLAALDKHLSGLEGVSWVHPAGGLYVWMTLPETVDTSREGMFVEAAAAGVLYVPGNYCMTPDLRTGKVANHSLRLCFGSVPPEQIEPGVRRLAAVIRGRLAGQPRPTTAGVLERVG